MRDVVYKRFACCILSFSLILSLGCQRKLPIHPASKSSAESVLLRASGACLAKISKLEEFDEVPGDGDHYVKAWLEPIEESGIVPEYLYLVIHYGGHMTLEDYQELQQREMTLRYDSLKVGELHWFVFSEDYDSSKFPYHVAAWWKHSAGSVPQDIIKSIRKDRFGNNPKWDKTLNVVYEASQAGNEIDILVRKADSLAEEGILFQKTVPGKLASFSLNHWNGSYEAEWPEGREMHIAMLHTVGNLESDNEFSLESGTYRINYAFDIETGNKFAQWLAADQESWLMKSFQQYDLSTGDVMIDMNFELLPTGGLAVGAETENWYRRTVRKYESGKMIHKAIYRHESIRTGKEKVFSGSGWLPVTEANSLD